MARARTLAETIELSAGVFAGKVKKTVVLCESGQALFNPGAYRAADGHTYLFVRFSTHHGNYPGWIRLHASANGTAFFKEKEHFIWPGYTVNDYSVGCEDDRCSPMREWLVHTHSLLLARDTRSPNRARYDDYIGVALGRAPDEAVPAGIVAMRGNKNAACVEAGSRTFLFHRPLEWGDPPCIWCGDFSRGFEEAVRNAADGTGGSRVPGALPRLAPPVDNRIVLAPLPAWSVYKIGLGAQPLAVGSRYLFTYHARSDPYQYWWSAGFLREKDGRLTLERLLPFPVCFPDTPWEMIGDVPKVSFLCGATRAHVGRNRALLEADDRVDNSWLKALLP
ncbi:MAG: hypothetical protein ABII00_16445 [Elusimicrobiota bacterium]